MVILVSFSSPRWIFYSEWVSFTDPVTVGESSRTVTLNVVTCAPVITKSVSTTSPGGISGTHLVKSIISAPYSPITTPPLVISVAFGVRFSQPPP